MAGDFIRVLNQNAGSIEEALEDLRTEVALMDEKGGASGDAHTRRVAYAAQAVVKAMERQGESQ